jgi:hypothetical protein
MFVVFGDERGAQLHLKSKGIPIEENPIPEDVIFAIRDCDNEDDWPEDAESVDDVAAMTSLSDMIDWYVEQHVNWHDGTFDEEAIEEVHRLRRILEAGIKRIDDTIVEGNKNLKTKEIT